VRKALAGQRMKAELLAPWRIVRPFSFSRTHPGLDVNAQARCVSFSHYKPPPMAHRAAHQPLHGRTITAPDRRVCDPPGASLL